MNINKTKNVSFGANIKFVRQADAENKLVKFPINYLKHHCGGKNVEHNAELSKDGLGLMIFSNYAPKNNKEVSGFGFMKRVDISSTKEQILEQLNEIKKWVKKTKIADK